LGYHFTVGTSYEKAATLAEKNTAAGLSDFSVCGATQWQFSHRSGTVLSQEALTVK
jgi:hypothetical protein